MTKPNRSQSFVARLLSIAMVAGLSVQVHGQGNAPSVESIEEVIVTSRYREESLQDVPDTIVALDSLEIQQRNITDLMDVANSVPLMNYENILHFGSTFINMRGISTQRGSEPGVSVYIDGIQSTTPLQLSQELFDIESIEVLKGPQGALYGRSAIAGAINIVTKKPTDEFENVARVGFADGGEYSVNFKSSGPIVPGELYYSIFGGTMEYDGGIMNTFLNEEVDFRENDTFRGRLLWTPSDELTIDAFVNMDDLYGGTYHFSTIVDETGRAVFGNGAASHDWPVQAEVLTTGDRKFEEAALNVTFEPGFGGTIKYSFALHDYEEHYGLPGTAAGGIIDPTYPTGNYDMTPLYAIHNSQSFWRESMLNEIRYISDSDKSVRYVIGAQLVNVEMMDLLPAFINEYFFPNAAGEFPGVIADNVNAGRPLTFGMGSVPMFGPVNFSDTSRNIDALGYYAQVNVDITPNTELTLAYRRDEDERDWTENASGIYDERTFSGGMPKVSVAHTLSDNRMVYATVSKGWRSGGFNKIADQSDTTAFSQLFKEEEVMSYEIGYKSSFNEGRGRFNFAIFQQDVDNHQHFVFIAAQAGQITATIPEGTVDGIEFELTHALDNGFEYGIAGGYIDSEITEFDGIALGYGRPMSEASGEPVLGAQFPSIDQKQLNLHAQYATDTDLGEMIARVDWNHKGDKQWFIVKGQNEEGNRNFLNASLILDMNKLELMLWGENLTDEDSWGSFEPKSLHNLPQDIANLAPGRRYGLKATYRF